VGNNGSSDPVTTQRGMEPRDLFRICWNTDAQMDPRGKRVAFVVTHLDEERDDYTSAVWTVGVSGGEPSRFTAGQRRDTAPRWSPDGRWLAFLSDREEKKAQLYIAPTGGGEARRLTEQDAGVTSFVWSPDSRSICFVAKVQIGDAPDPKPANQTPPARVITSLKYKYNGEGFIYDKRRHLFLLDVDGGSVRQLTDGDFNDDQPAWSSDSLRIAFVSARHESRDLDRVSDLFVVQTNDGSIEQLTDGGFSLSAPAWSPDGTSVAFLGYRGPEDAPRHARLWIVQSGSPPRCLTDAYDRALAAAGGSTHSGPIWTLAGDAVFLSAQDRGNTLIVQVDTRQGDTTPVLDGERSVTGFSVNGSVQLFAFAASTSNHPAEIFVAPAGGGSERQLTRLNAALAKEIRFIAPERVAAEAADGTPIDGWLMRPVNYEPGVPHPVLLNIHGGPYAQYGASFLDEFQVQAGAGFGVVFCNPRGSSGYGEPFARAIIAEPGIKDTDDVLRSLDAVLAAKQDLDRARIGVIGGSYGGYLTSWIIGHSDRFAAACSERGINNRLSKAGTDDINTTWTYFRVEPHREPELLLRLSPLMFADAMRAPLLLMHSEEDLRCPIEQAEQLFVALKRLQRDVVFVRFPGENHDLSRSGKPSHRIARFRLQLDFFADRMGVASGLPADEMMEVG